MPDNNLLTRAMNAAAAVALKSGISAGRANILNASRHVCVLLPECSMLARTIHATEANAAAAARELAVTRYLSERGAPVVGPWPGMPSEPHVEDGMLVTLWPHVAHETAGHDDTVRVRLACLALRSVLDTLRDYPGALPSVLAKIENCLGMLRDPSMVLALSAGDRVFLLTTYDRLMGSLPSFSISQTPIHGDAHMGNVLFAAAGPVWTDFEATCRGPREWDAAGMGEPAAFQPLDSSLHFAMSGLLSFCMTVWCSALADDPNKRAAATYHFERLERGMRLGRFGAP